MQSKRKSSEEVSCVSVTKIKKTLSEEGFLSQNFRLTPLLRLQELEGVENGIDGMVVLIVVSGTAKNTINGRNYELRPNSLLILRGDSAVGAFKSSKAAMGYLIHFSEAFISSVGHDAADKLISDIMVSAKPCIELRVEDTTRLHAIAALVGRMSSVDGIYGEKILSSLANTLYYMLVAIIGNYSLSAMSGSDTLSRAGELIRQFASELVRSCHQERSVEYYASKLGITPKYLSLVCKKQTGRNASKIIDDAVIGKAKELLAQPGLSILEVSERLNFVSQSFFGKYFKQRTGISPSRYKALG